MTYQAEKKRWPAMLAAAAGGILGAAALMWARWPDDEPAPAPAPPPATAAPVVAGTAPPRGVSPLREPGVMSSDIALTDNQELIADSALRKVMDSYLLGGGDKGGLQALLDYLNRHLPANAARQAGQLASSYNAYLGAHDQLLAAQNFGATPDLNRLIGWQRQREQLRNRMLGEKITLEWFGNEEAYLTQALEELSQRRDGTAPPSNSTDEDQMKHDQHMQQVLRDAIIALRPMG
ncbi:hypothetical protein [Burkholderia sp. LMU1-1-1.1]|uniref:hypothetical protein n=1 Tax=Burkholderia sp. LMU1-1-1.1 TaxID=3135266 RepID=UPI00343CA68F